MENLTRSLRLAYNAPDCSPIPDHDLVIFKKLGPGLEFREVVPIGKRFRKRFWEFGEFEAFGVRRHSNLFLTFSHPVKHIDPKYRFVLHFRVNYEVENPRRLVEKIESDPLKEIKDQTITLLSRTARHTKWEKVLDEVEFERTVLGSKIFSEEGIEFSNLERLRQIAEAVGLKIKTISIQRTIPKEESVAEIDHDEELDHELALRRQDRDGELKRKGSFRDAVTEVGARTIVRMTDPSSAGDTLKMVGALGQVEKESKVLIGSSSTKPLSADGAPLAITRGNGIAGTLAAEILEVMPSLGTGTLMERQLTSSMLHLIAELSLGRDADDGRLKDYAAAITPLLRELYDKLSPGQLDLIHRLQEPLSRKKEISEATL